MLKAKCKEFSAQNGALTKEIEALTNESAEKDAALTFLLPLLPRSCLSSELGDLAV